MSFGTSTQYLAAGADIVETNTFGATAIAQAEYGLSHRAREMNLASARLAREAVDAHREATGQPAWVAGAVGPTNVTLSASSDVDDPSSRAASWDDVYAAYLEQVIALIEGGCDIVLIETIFDVLNAKAAIKAVLDAFDHTGVTLPIMISRPSSKRRATEPCLVKAWRPFGPPFGTPSRSALD